MDIRDTVRSTAKRALQTVSAGSGGIELSIAKEVMEMAYDGRSHLDEHFAQVVTRTCCEVVSVDPINPQ